MKRLLLLISMFTALSSMAAQEYPVAGSQPFTMPDGGTATFESAIKKHEQVLGNDCEGESAWLPMANGLPGPAEYSTVMNDELYVLYVEQPHDGTFFYYAIARWTGKEWQTVTSLRCDEMAQSFQAYKGELYVGGIFKKVQGIPGKNIPGTTGIVKWNGTQWVSVDGGLWQDFITAVYDMCEYQGELIATGTFLYIGKGVTARSIARWDGVEWKALDGGLWGHGGASVGLALAVHDGALYVGGGFWEAGETPKPVTVSNIAKWNGSSWSAFGEGVTEGVEEIIVYKDELYVFGRGITHAGSTAVNQMAKWTGSEWQSAGVGPKDGARIKDFKVFNGSLYAVGRIPALGDALNASGVVRYDGTRWHTVAGLRRAEEHAHLDVPDAYFLEVVNSTLYAGGLFVTSCETPLNYIARFCDEDNCGKITGHVFADENDNCLKDTNEYSLANRIIYAQPDDIYAKVRTDGSYTAWVRPGTHTVSVNQRNYWQQSCPATGTYTVTINTPGELVSGKNFAFEATEQIRELEVSIVGSRARPGQDVVYSIRYENVGTQPFTGLIEMAFDPVLTYIGSIPQENTINNHTLEWNIENLPVGAAGSIRMNFVVPPYPSLLGSVICGQVWSSTSGPNHNNGEDRYCVGVTGSFDPNMIVVTPAGTQPEGYITRKDTVLQYVIHFQNTGNDTAFKVVIMDKVPEHLDLSTLRAGASSHKYELDITKNNELKWTFNNIMLPDSNVSEPNSHGFVKYEIQLKKGLPVGTEIRNAADIYFDFNEPVRTNEVKNVITLQSPTGVEEHAEETLSMYPNPADDRVTISSPLLVRGMINVYNSLGEAVLSLHHTGGTQIDINTSKLAPGAYYISYPVAGGTTGRVLTIVR